MMKLLDLQDLSEEMLPRVLERARALEHAPRSDLLQGRVAGLLFLNPSLRTLASMQAAMAQLGGASFAITPGQGTWPIETRTGAVMDGDRAEHLREAIPVLAQYADLLAVRSFAALEDLAVDLADGVISEAAELCPKPFLNLESARSHPLQSLADWKTLDDLGLPAARDGRFVLSWVWHPRALPLAVAASTVEMAARRGMHVTVLRPDGFALPPEIMARARSLAARAGGAVEETADRRAALAGAHVLYAKSWMAPTLYGRPEEEAALRAPLRGWCVDEPWFANAAPRASFLHCLPVRRNVKVTDRVLDGPRSAVVRQAANRLHVQKALILELLAKEIGA